MSATKSSFRRAGKQTHKVLKIQQISLWRVSIAYLKNFYEMPLTWPALDVFHDLQARRYHVQQLDNEEDKIVNFQTPPSDEAFTPAALRRRGTR